MTDIEGMQNGGGVFNAKNLNYSNPLDHNESDPAIDGVTRTL